MPFYRRILASMLFLCLFCSVHSENNMIIEHYSKENGLPCDMVNCTLKDSDGFIWFGTRYGLSCFDGSDFMTFNNNSGYFYKVFPQKINNIIENKNGYLWIHTYDEKLYVFDKAQETFKNFIDCVEKYLGNIHVVKIQKLSDTEILILTKSKDLFIGKIDNKRGNVDLDVVFRAGSDINTYTKKLLHNVFYETKDYFLWIGMDYKIYFFRKNRLMAAKPPDYITKKINIGSSGYTCAFSDSSDFVIGDNSGNIYTISLTNGNISEYNIVKGNPILNMYMSAAGEVYAHVKNKGLLKYNIITGKKYKVDLGVKVKDLQLFYIDKYEKLWFIADDKNIIYYDDLKKNVHRFPIPFQKEKFTMPQIKETDNGDIFILTAYGRVFYFDRENFSMTLINELEQCKIKDALQIFNNMYLDRDGLLWLTSSNSGVYSIDFKKYQFNILDLRAYLDKSVSYSSDYTNVRSMCQTKNGDYWIGTKSGDLYRFNSDFLLKNIYSDSKYHLGKIYHIMEDDKGFLWLSTKGNGLIKVVFDNKFPDKVKFITYKNNPDNIYSLSNNNVYMTYQDSKKRIWVATFGGGINLITAKGDSVLFINNINGFFSYSSYGLYMNVRSIVEDYGRIWVATSDGLLSFDSEFKFSDKIFFENYRNSNINPGISENDIHNLYKDEDNNLWVSIFGGGLCRISGYDEKGHKPDLRFYGVNEGLENNVIVSIVEDIHNILWIATYNGLLFFDKSKGRFHDLSVYSGVRNTDMGENCAIRTNNGGIWFGSKRGIIMINPDDLMADNYKYNLFFTDLQISNKNYRLLNPPVLNKSIRYVDTVILKYTQSTFEMRLAALNFKDNSNVKYKYMLVDYDKTWHESNTVNYTKIPPGEYILKAKVISSVNKANDIERDLHIIVLAPWWRTWWAYSIYIILSSGLIFLILYFSVSFLKMKNNIYLEHSLAELRIKFFTNVSHELRTPLTLIKGPLTELMQKKDLTPKESKYFDIMNNNTDELLNLVNEILDFRKISNGKMRLSVSKYDIVLQINKICSNFLAMAEEKNIDMQIVCNAEHANIWADKKKIRSVIKNILSNAFKVSSDGGVIKVEFGLSDKDDKYIISISDTGPGISDEQKDKLFERFYQGKSNRDESIFGSGIGLALSKDIVELHKGDIRIEDVSPHGAKFVISLYKGREHLNEDYVDFYFDDMETYEKDEKSGDEIVIKKIHTDAIAYNEDLPTILFVDDNAELRSFIALQFEGKYNFISAKNGKEGIIMINKYSPDIVISDLMMPEMDGLTMLKNIRKDFSISHIPVIILSAKNNPQSRTEAIESGANFYIQKPFSKRYLQACIERILEDRNRFRKKVYLNREETDKENPEDKYEQYLIEKDFAFLRKVNETIEENISNSDFNIDTIASVLGLSRSSFYKKLKSLTGISPVDFVKEYRLAKALEIIKTSDMSVFEIAYKAGFKDAGYFSKCFKKRYNISPSDYIAKHRKV